MCDGCRRRANKLLGALSPLSYGSQQRTRMAVCAQRSPGLPHGPPAFGTPGAKASTSPQHIGMLSASACQHNSTESLGCCRNADGTGCCGGAALCLVQLPVLCAGLHLVLGHCHCRCGHKAALSPGSPVEGTAGSHVCMTHNTGPKAGVLCLVF